MTFKLPELHYAYDGLLPYMSRRTLELHHGKHHQAYVSKLNDLIAGTPFAQMPLEDIVRKSHGDPKMQAIFNNAGQHYNHSKFWLCMKPDGGSAIPHTLEKRLADRFGSLTAFKAEFVARGAAQFGSGWVWLVEKTGGGLDIVTTSNADSPLAAGHKPLLVCDVWEHAYYVDYQNRRPDFLMAFLDHLVDWSSVASGRIAEPSAAEEQAA
jgi:Fe-Mn family superoxide dismutase